MPVLYSDIDKDSKRWYWTDEEVTALLAKIKVLKDAVAVLAAGYRPEEDP